MGQYGFGLKDCQIATLTDESGPTWDTAVDVAAIQMMGVTLNMISAELEGDDEIVDAHAKIISGTLQMRFGFGANHIEIWGVLVGKAHVDSGNDDYLVISSENPDYFGVCGKVEDTSEGGDLHIWAPKCKLMEGLSLQAQYGQYMTPEMNVRCLRLNDTHGIIVPIHHETATDVVIPPVFGAA